VRIVVSRVRESGPGAPTIGRTEYTQIIDSKMRKDAKKAQK